jgi:hypothetical protein
MNKIQTIGQNFWDSVSVMWMKIFDVLPNILIAIIILMIGWLVARSLSYIVFKAIQLSKVEKFASKALGRDVTKKSETGWNMALIVKKAVYWAVILLFAVFASETLGWQIVTQELSNIIAYIPRLLTAVVIFIIGMYIAGFIRQAISVGINSIGIRASGVISTIAYYLILVLVTITALNQAGVNTGAITSNFVIIIGSVFLAFALAFGLGAKDVLGNIVAGLYTRKNFHSGQRIKIDGKEGTIEKIDSINFVLKTGDSRIIMPIKKLVEETVEIISEN